MTARLRALRILAAGMAVGGIGFGLFTVVFGLVSPDQAPHAFHNPIVASLLIVLSAPPLIAIARAPERPIRPLVVLAAIGVAALATMAMALTIDPFTLPFVVLVAVLWAVATDRADAFPAGAPSVAMLALSALAAAALGPYAVAQAELQRTDQVSEHAAFFHWVEMAFYATAIPLLGLLAGLRPAAYRMAAWCAAVALAILGIASLVYGEYASALPVPMAWVVAVGSVVFIVVAEWEDRRQGPAR
jgi:hypothetical protein